MAIEWAAVLSRLNRVPGFSATAEHVALFKDLHEQTQKENEQLRAECARLKMENEDLRRQIASSGRQVELEEIGGILWKRKPTGGFDTKPRCPNCQDHPVMGEFPPETRLHWVCSRCKGVFDYEQPPS